MLRCMNEDAMRHDTTEEAEETGAAEVSSALLTAEQAAQILGISTRRLRDWRKEGRIAEVGRFKRGTARIPLFDPTEVLRVKAAQAAEEAPEAPATAVTPAMDAAAFAEAVARQVGLMLAERAEAEAATVTPLVALVKEQQETIDELRRRAAVAEEEVARRRREEAERWERVRALVREREAASGIRRFGSMLRKHLNQVSDEQEAREAWGAAPPAPLAPTFWERVRARLWGE